MNKEEKAKEKAKLKSYRHNIEHAYLSALNDTIHKLNKKKEVVTFKHHEKEDKRGAFLVELKSQLEQHTTRTVNILGKNENTIAFQNNLIDAIMKSNTKIVHKHKHLINQRKLIPRILSLIESIEPEEE